MCMKHIFSILLFLAVSLIPLAAQTPENLLNDPRITKGVMDNGLTYYLVQNSTQKGYADFFLVQKVGTSMESSSQKGMTELIGNMGVRSTRNFPDGDLYAFINQLGMSVKEDCKTIVGANQCLFGLSNIPVGAGESVIDSALLVLFNISSCININENKIQSDKTFFLNNHLGGMTPSIRAENYLKSELFKGTVFAPPTPQELSHSIANISSGDIRDYYATWSRPDLQAIIVVGDIDPTAIASKVRMLFQATSKGTSPTPREYGINPSFIGPQKIFFKDNEASSARISLYLVSDAIPVEYRSTAVALVNDYMGHMMMDVICRRLKLQAEALPFHISSIDIDYGRWLDLNDKESYKIEIVTSPGYASDAYKFLLTEIERLNKYGISVDEYNLASDKYISTLNYQYDWRIKTSNDVFTDRCIENFIDGYSLASIELCKEYIDKMMYHINVEKLNSFIHSYIVPANRLFYCVSPEDVNMDIDCGSIDPYTPSSQVVDTTKIDIVSGKIVTTSKEPISGATMWTLSNGAIVLLKDSKIEPSRVYFKAFAKGGISSIDDNASLSPDFLNLVANIGSKESPSSLSRGVSYFSSHLNGSFSSSDVDLFMNGIYRSFTDFKYHDEAFGIINDYRNDMLLYAGNDPSAVLNRMKSDVARPQNEGTEINYHYVADQIKEMFSNAADYTFVFVGDIDENLYKAPVCKFIASLPGNPHTKNTGDINKFSIERFDKTTLAYLNMDPNREYHNIRVTLPSPFDIKGRALSNAISTLLERKIVDKMVDEGVSVNIRSRIKRFPKEVISIDFSFVTKDNDDNIDEVFKSILKDISSEGVDNREWSAIRASVINGFDRKEQMDNNFWIDVLNDRFLYGKDFYSQYDKEVDSITLETVNETLKDYLDKAIIAISLIKPNDNSHSN